MSAANKVSLNNTKCSSLRSVVYDDTSDNIASVNNELEWLWKGVVTRLKYKFRGF
jgi:hypothetical protein